MDDLIERTFALFYTLIGSLLLTLLIAACNNSDTPAHTPVPATATLRPSNSTSLIDPGPYFTPNRLPPTNPEEFTPPWRVGRFVTVHSSGSCVRVSGLTVQYNDDDGQTLFFTCHYMTTSAQATEQIKQLIDVTDSIYSKIQKDESFALTRNSDGRLFFAWMHGHWLFQVRGPSDRDLLDNFMLAFPY